MSKIPAPPSITEALAGHQPMNKRAALFSPQENNMCSKGSGPMPLQVKLTVYFRDDGGTRVLSGIYPRRAAAYRLRFARHLENFKGHKTEAA